MKNKVLLLLLPAISCALGATIPTLQVTVTNAAGKVAYKGTTNANGAFTTGNLEPGNYVVEFDAKGKMPKGSKFALGANNVSSDSVPGEKFVDPGMAMRVTVVSNTKITGQVAPAGTLAKQTQAVASTSTKASASTKKWSGPVNVINGKRYIWVLPYTGSVSGGRWVEEDSPEGRQAEGQEGQRIQGRDQTRPQQPMHGGY